MAKGARKQALNQAQSEQKQAQGYTAGANTTANNALNAEMPTVMSYLQPGGNPAVTAATMGALGSKFGSEEAQARDAASRTNNAASTNAVLQSLGRTQGQEAATAAAKNISDQQKTALDQLSRIYGISTDQLAKMMGLQVEATNTYGKQANSPWLTTVLPAALEAAGQGAKAFAGGGGGG